MEKRCSANCDAVAVVVGDLLSLWSGTKTIRSPLAVAQWIIGQVRCPCLQDHSSPIATIAARLKAIPTASQEAPSDQQTDSGRGINGGLLH